MAHYHVFCESGSVDVRCVHHEGAKAEVAGGASWVKSVDFDLPDGCPLYPKSGGKADIDDLRVLATNRRIEPAETASHMPLTAEMPESLGCFAECPVS
jgi:hypothetical protein